MARASNIYVVHENHFIYPSVAFTVKHECITWLQGQMDIDVLEVITLGDGLHNSGLKKVMKARDFMEGKK